ncbi:MAG: hypothetical protein KJP21_01905 [Bacteroidia bacterium]|nr:hypothetical protein [Bacteroidia bacterium]NNJ56463.1 hypothetical protein [Bacteroidia bacterium]
MKSQLTVILYVSVISLFAYSCSPVYIPNSTMVFENEAAGEGSVKYRQGIYSTNIQGGYAVSDNFNVGIAVNGLHTTEVTIGTITDLGVQAVEVNAVAGYFNKFTASNVFELNVGGGSVFYSRPSEISEYYKLFAQPSISFKNLNENFKATISARMTGVAFNYNDAGIDTAYFRGFGEPMVSLSFGKKVQFLMQGGISIPLQTEEVFESSPFIFNVGIGYKFGNKRSEFIEP